MRRLPRLLLERSREDKNKGKQVQMHRGKIVEKGKVLRRDNGKKEKPNRIEEQEQRLYMGREIVKSVTYKSREEKQMRIE